MARGGGRTPHREDKKLLFPLTAFPTSHRLSHGAGRRQDSRIVCAGAGSAGLGVCLQIIDGMVEAGLSRKARPCCALQSQLCYIVYMI